MAASIMAGRSNAGTNETNYNTQTELEISEHTLLLHERLFLAVMIGAGARYLAASRSICESELQEIHMFVTRALLAWSHMRVAASPSNKVFPKSV